MVPITGKCTRSTSHFATVLAMGDGADRASAVKAEKPWMVLPGNHEVSLIRNAVSQPMGP